METGFAVTAILSVILNFALPLEIDDDIEAVDPEDHAAVGGDAALESKLMHAETGSNDIDKL